MRFRHLDYPGDTPVGELGPAALEALLESGDLDDWRPLVDAITDDPYGRVARTVETVCTHHQMYGTSRLFLDLISRRRRLPLAEWRTSRGLTQTEVARRMGTTQAQVSKLENNPDPKLSAVRAYAAALGMELTFPPARRPSRSSRRTDRSQDDRTPIR